MATYVTVQNLCDRLTRLSGQVPGSSVQVYSQDIFIDYINSAVRMIGRRFWWPHLMGTITTMTDGSTGVLTADLSKVADIVDIRSIYAGSNNRQIPYFSDLNNRALYSGSTACGFEAIAYGDAQYLNKVIRILPATAVENVTLRVRYMPKQLGIADQIPFDADMILYAVLWAYFEDEGDNPQQAQKYASLFNAKFTQQISAYAEHGISLEDNYPVGANDWQYTP